ncbi:hypothetical protein [Bifidobacterium cuniculi]|uniref:Uncharacterized protein n=1 Tax=Bifidobacterium cuniculi TaxID=1688 RepID=A0A087ALZ5_9BIFI|nr:hypothetical protein [Bifidobacterium cuniculi]KFI59795.1 hypothetical protein BCUN_1562 [Bifidobacterium cuniculi]
MNDDKDMKDETQEFLVPPDGQERDLLDVPLDERFVEENGTVLDPTLVMGAQPEPAGDTTVETVVLGRVTEPPADDAIPVGDGGEDVADGMDADADVRDASASGPEGQGEAGSPGAPVPPTRPQQVPLYATTPGPLPQQQPAPTGPSAATIVLGAIVTLVGILALVVGALMDTTLLSFAQLHDLGGYLFAGLGIFLAVVAVAWAVAGAVRKRQR